MKKSDANQGQPASELISKRIAELGDWRRETLSRMRKLIREADPDCRRGVEVGQANQTRHPGLSFFQLAKS